MGRPLLGSMRIGRELDDHNARTLVTTVDRVNRDRDQGSNSPFE
jgi:hypothetical protein